MHGQYYCSILHHELFANIFYNMWYMHQSYTASGIKKYNTILDAAVN